MQEFQTAESFLKHAHAKFPGETPKWFSRPLDPAAKSKKNSYDLLVSVVPKTKTTKVVVDLACGDGYLTEQLLQARPGISVVGIDMSEEELSLARKRFKKKKIGLKCENARALSLPDASVDFVLCHMALMLMDSVEDVIKEVARVLKPGGVFSAIIGNGWKKGPIQDLFLLSLRQALAFNRVARFAAMGDPRVRSLDGLNSLFKASDRFELPLAIQDSEMQIALTPAALVQFLMGAYETVCLSDEGRTQLQGDLSTGLETQKDNQGLVPYAIGLRQITVQRKTV